MAGPTTPMLKQYWEIKNRHSQAILFFRMGDFYEMFGDDAIEASKILGIALTARNKGTPNETPMCGIPYHSAENYIVKITKAGKKVAICEQMTPPGKGLVERKVIRIITPGTTLNENVLDQKSHNFIASIYIEKNTFGFAVSDVSTGTFEINETDDKSLLKSLLFRLSPTEIVTHESFLDDINKLAPSGTIINTHKTPFGFAAHSALEKHLEVTSLNGFGIEDLAIGILAGGFLFDYIKETQKTDLSHIKTLKRYHFNDYMLLDETAIRNLELLFTMHNGFKEGSLINIIDETKTAMAGRMLKQWLLHPLLSKHEIKERLDAVEFAIKELDREEITKALSNIADIERIVGKIGLERANARDLSHLKQSLFKIKEIKNLLPEISVPFLEDVYKNLSDHGELIEKLETSIHDEPPIEITEGGIIKDGYSRELDSLREIASGGKDWINKLAVQEIARTGINSLKIRFNKVFGYYIEISKSNLGLVPADYIRKQTLVNAERFITPELKEYEEKVLGAEEKIYSLEYELFLKIRRETASHIPEIQKTAIALSKLDVITGFAELAIKNNYIKPQINDSGKIEIKQGRHPVIEKMLKDEQYIPNDAYLDNNNYQIILLTGPNMSGKSSYLRQVALITLLAQIGCFVPAENADISIVDRIFTRVGASDNLARGQSTFMVEMQEASNILHNASAKSLIILDELGRGTSTYDGLSIAWAILDNLHHEVGAKTLFATHYHELIEVVESLPKAQNFSVAVAEHKGSIVFLHQVQKGGTPESYGIEVAKLAGLPKSVISKSQEILKKLEEEHTGQMKLI